MRNADQPAAVGVGPAVVGAAEEPAVAELMLAHRRTAVTAAVEQRSDAAVAQPRQDDRVLADIGRLVVARLADLAGVPEIDPGAPEYALHLEVEDRRIGIDRPMHRIAAYQRTQILICHYFLYNQV
jgi:hypothetical protein